MKVFLSALENGNNDLILKRVKMLYNLMSFYYIKGKRKLAEEILVNLYHLIKLNKKGATDGNSQDSGK